MTTALTTNTSNYPAFAMKEDELINVLRNSLYPGAQTDSIKMIIGYCKASSLDPMQKPVHIVPIWDSKAGAMRDVVMPGIGLYRAQASRSGEYAGVTEPEFGEDVTELIGGIETTYPKWCRVTVKRLLGNGSIVEFTANERWKENYAAKGGKDKSIAPNAMWARRPYAQLAKCSEAQALRKAFPEFGAQPTADEMEGKEFDVTPETAPPAPVYYTNDEFSTKKQKWKQAVVDGKQTNANLIIFAESKSKLFTEAQLAEINSWKKAEVIEQEPIDPFLADMEAAEKGME